MQLVVITKHLKCQNHIVHLCNCIIITKDQEIEIQYKCEMEIVL